MSDYDDPEGILRRDRDAEIEARIQRPNPEAPYRRRRVRTDAQTGERVWAIVYVAVLLDRQENSVRDCTKTFYQEAEEEADRARATWFKRVNGTRGEQTDAR